MLYLIIESMFGTEIIHRYPTDKRNDRFTRPRIMRMWKAKANRIYLVYPDSTCEIIKGEW